MHEVLDMYRSGRARYAARVLAVAAAIAAPLVLTSALQQELLVLTVVYAVMALSLGVIMGQTGQWSFGHQAFVGIGAYASALLAIRLHLPVLLGFAFAAALSGACGMVLGYVALRRTRGMYLAIVTVAFGQIAYLLAAHWYQLTGGPVGLVEVPYPDISVPGLPTVTIDNDTAYYYFGLVLLALVAYLLMRMSDSKLGIGLRALRNNEPLARSVGIAPLRHYVLGFGAGSALAGLSGAMLGHYLGAISPALFGFDFLFAMLTMVILGGMSTIGGPILGAAIFIWVPRLLGVSDSVRVFLFSLLIALILPVLPQGIYPAAVGVLSLNWLRRQPAARVDETRA